MMVFVFGDTITIHGYMASKQQNFNDVLRCLLKGYYDTMDAGFIDKDGYVSIMSRTDDVINVAGHRCKYKIIAKWYL